MNGAEDKSSEDKRMTFGEHLDELRRRFVICLLGVGLIFIVALCFQQKIVDFARIPFNQAAAALLEDGRVVELQQIEATETFLFYIKVCLATGVLFGFPLILLQMWQFIAAGLYKTEKKTVMRVLPGSIALMFAGMSFGFFVLLPFGLEFLMGYGASDIPTSIRISNYFTFLVAVTLVMGFLFQLPLVMSVLAMTGLVKSQTFRKYRRHFIVSAFVAAAFLTPPDPGTQIMVGVPLIFLFEAGVWLSAGIEKRRKVNATVGSGDSEVKS